MTGLDGHIERVHTAHHGVHADSLGALLSIGSDQLFHSGARPDGVPEGCLETIRVLGDVSEALLRPWHAYTRDRRYEVVRAMLDELSLTLQRDCLSQARAADQAPVAHT